MGHLDPEARARRAVKNARNRNRVHPIGAVHALDMPVAGADARATSRLAQSGNRQARGAS
jgi:hypothetical protein